jgi:pSer/pThr/pTyr-binding forkhead associated (FHA) protein
MAGESSSKSSVRPPGPPGERTCPVLIPQGALLGQPDVPLDRPVTTVGSNENARLHLVSRTVSKGHAIFVNNGPSTYVADLASRTGVLVNGKLVKDADLKTGDRVQIGKFVFRYRSPAKSPRGPIPQAPPASVIVVGWPAMPVVSKVVQIGRRDTSDIAFTDDAAVSAAHAVIFQMNGSWYIRDVGSRTGTTVNGKAIHQQQLNFGDRIVIGSSNVLFQPGVMEEEQSLEPETELTALPPNVDEAAVSVDLATAPIPAEDRLLRKASADDTVAADAYAEDVLAEDVLSQGDVDWKSAFPLSEADLGEHGDTEAIPLEPVSEDTPVPALPEAPAALPDEELTEATEPIDQPLTFEPQAADLTAEPIEETSVHEPIPVVEAAPIPLEEMPVHSLVPETAVPTANATAANNLLAADVLAPEVLATDVPVIQPSVESDALLTFAEEEAIDHRASEPGVRSAADAPVDEEVTADNTVAEPASPEPVAEPVEVEARDPSAGTEWGGSVTDAPLKDAPVTDAPVANAPVANAPVGQTASSFADGVSGVGAVEPVNAETVASVTASPAPAWPIEAPVAASGGAPANVPAIPDSLTAEVDDFVFVPIDESGDPNAVPEVLFWGDPELDAVAEQALAQPSPALAQPSPALSSIPLPPTAASQAEPTVTVETPSDNGDQAPEILDDSSTAVVDAAIAETPVPASPDEPIDTQPPVSAEASVETADDHSGVLEHADITAEEISPVAAEPATPEADQPPPQPADETRAEPAAAVLDAPVQTEPLQPAPVESLPLESALVESASVQAVDSSSPGDFVPEPVVSTSPVVGPSGPEESATPTPVAVLPILTGEVIDPSPPISVPADVFLLAKATAAAAPAYSSVAAARTTVSPIGELAFAMAEARQQLELSGPESDAPTRATSHAETQADSPSETHAESQLEIDTAVDAMPSDIAEPMSPESADWSGISTVDHLPGGDSSTHSSTQGSEQEELPLAAEPPAIEAPEDRAASTHEELPLDDVGFGALEVPPAFAETLPAIEAPTFEPPVAVEQVDHDAQGHDEQGQSEQIRGLVSAEADLASTVQIQEPPAPEQGLLENQPGTVDPATAAPQQTHAAQPTEHQVLAVEELGSSSAHHDQPAAIQESVILESVIQESPIDLEPVLTAMPSQEEATELDTLDPLETTEPLITSDLSGISTIENLEPQDTAIHTLSLSVDAEPIDAADKQVDQQITVEEPVAEPATIEPLELETSAPPDVQVSEEYPSIPAATVDPVDELEFIEPEPEFEPSIEPQREPELHATVEPPADWSGISTVDESPASETVTRSEASVADGALESAPLESAPLESAPLESAPLESAPLESAPVESARIEAAPINDLDFLEFTDTPAQPTSSEPAVSDPPATPAVALRQQVAKSTGAGPAPAAKGKPTGPSLFGFDFEGGSFLGGMPLPLNVPPPPTSSAPAQKSPVFNALAEPLGGLGGVTALPPGSVSLPPAAPRVNRRPKAPTKTQPEKPLAPQPTSLTGLVSDTASPWAKAPVIPPTPKQAGKKPRPATPGKPLTTTFNLPGSSPRTTEVFSQMASPIGVEVFGGKPGNPDQFIVPDSKNTASAELVTNTGMEKAADPLPYAPPVTRKPRSSRLPLLILLLLGAPVLIWELVYHVVPVSSRIVGSIQFTGLSGKDDHKFMVAQESRLYSDQVRRTAVDIMRKQGLPPGFLDDPTVYAQTVDKQYLNWNENTHALELIYDTSDPQLGRARVAAVMEALKQKDKDLQDEMDRDKSDLDMANARVAELKTNSDKLLKLHEELADQAGSGPGAAALQQEDQDVTTLKQKWADAHALVASNAAYIEELKKQDPTRPVEITSDAQVLQMQKDLQQLNDRIAALRSTGSVTATASPGNAPNVGTDVSVNATTQPTGAVDPLVVLLQKDADSLQHKLDNRKADLTARAAISPAQRVMDRDRDVENLSVNLASLQNSELAAKSNYDAAVEKANKDHAADSAAGIAEAQKQDVQAQMRNNERDRLTMAEDAKEKQAIYDNCITVAAEPQISQPKIQTDLRQPFFALGTGIATILIALLIWGELRRPKLIAGVRPAAAPLVNPPARVVPWPQPHELQGLKQTPAVDAEGMLV